MRIDPVKLFCNIHNFWMNFENQWNQILLAHKAFKGLAMRGKTSMGWLFGFKVHLIVNDIGELLVLS